MKVAFSHQFVVSKTPYSLPVEWSWRGLGELELATADDLPVVELVNEQNSIFAVLLGWPIDTVSQRIMSGTIQVTASQSNAFEQLLLTLAGRWLAINLDNEQVYADAMSSQSAIFHAGERIVCSSAALLPAELQLMNEKMSQRMNVAQSENFYPFGVLPQSGVQRLLPSHKISLKTATVSRYWWPFPEHWHGLEYAADIISAQVAGTISACVNSYPVRQGLSAGFETRLMLACSKAHLHHIQFWTRAETKRGSQLDQLTAQALSARFGLNYELISTALQPSDPVEQWLHRTGHCIGGGALQHRHLIDSIHQVYIALTGIGGETCRAFYWRSPHLPRRLNVELLLKLAGLPQLDEFIAAGKLYLQDISHLPVHVQLGLFYLENRVSAYASPHKYGNQHGIIFIYPLNHHDTVNQMLICPQALQLRSALHRQVIKQNWPELEQLPYNLPLQPVLRYLDQFKKLIGRYKSALYFWRLKRGFKAN